MQLPVVYVDATDDFLGSLAGITDPEHKRRIVGEEFIHVFEKEAARLEEVERSQNL